MKSFLSLLLALSASAMLFAADTSKEAERLQKAATVINEVMGTPEKGIPRNLLNKAVCVGIIPSQKKLALGLGGSYGRGCLVCRRGGNGPWGAPWTFAIGGPSIGFQIGGQATDFVLLVMNANGAQKLVKGKTKLGADASVAGGPVGRTAEGSTGVLMQTEILTYSRSRGAFAGLSLEGQVIKDDGDANERLYGRKIEAKEILFGNPPVPSAGRPLVAVLQRYSPRGGQAYKGK
ncbi:MAG: lipid-binding SYLF domain-containing protein [Acidobacteriia bacterium]|nr:lipid-binding SYLF domain-containing protein [Terriglobia bacterium]